VYRIQEYECLSMKLNNLEKGEYFYRKDFLKILKVELRMTP